MHFIEGRQTFDTWSRHHFTIFSRTEKHLKQIVLDKNRFNNKLWLHSNNIIQSSSHIFKIPKDQENASYVLIHVYIVKWLYPLNTQGFYLSILSQ